MARTPNKRPRRDEAPVPPDRHSREVERLREENERLRRQLEEQAKRIVDLERQLALKQQNSSSFSGSIDSHSAIQ
jgi:predicted RNase H-like nuclease (RuvC/YqgF family)